MKIISTLETKNKVRLLYAVIAYRRETEKIEKELKDWLKELMGDDPKVRIGEYLVTKTSQTRRGFDTEALRTYLGDKAKDFETETVYEVLDLETLHKVKGVL